MRMQAEIDLSELPTAADLRERLEVFSDDYGNRVIPDGAMVGVEVRNGDSGLIEAVTLRFTWET